MKPEQPQRRSGAADRQQASRSAASLGPVPARTGSEQGRDEPSRDGFPSSELPASGPEQALAEPRTQRRQRPPPTATQRALGLLTRREHSRKELARKLTTRGVADEEAEAAVDKLAAAGWQDDHRFAQSLVRSRANSGYGPLRIRAELATHGLDREAIATALDSYDGDFADNARKLVGRRHGPDAAGDPAARRKAAELLLRRGFAMEQVRAALQDPFDQD